MAMRSETKAKARAPGNAKAKSSADRVRAHRAKMKKQGMRLEQKWVADFRSPEFQTELKREARLLAQPNEEEEEIMRFIESHYEDWDK
jgi:hypothetical protein